MPRGVPQIFHIKRRSSVLGVVALLAALTFAKQLVWVTIVPVGQHPDEPAHASYSDDLARSGDLRLSKRHGSVALDILHDASGAFVMPFHADVIPSMDDEHAAEQQAVVGDIDHVDRQTAGAILSTASGYPPAGYLLPATTMRVTSSARFDVSYYSLRSIDALIGTATIVGFFFLYLQVLQSCWKSASAALFSTLLPMPTAVSSSISADVLLNLLGTLSALGLLHILTTPASWTRWLLVGAAIGMALLTKPAGVILLVPYIVTLLVVVVALRNRGRRTIARVGIRFAGGLALISILYGSWRLASAIQLGAAEADPLAQLPEAQLTRSSLTAYGDFLLREGRYRFGDTFWGVFGWLDTPMPAWSLNVAWYLTVGIAAVFIVELARKGLPSWTWVLGSAIVAAFAMLIFVEMRVYAATGVGMVQGRYMFIVLGPIVACAFWAIDSALESRPRMQAAALLGLPVLASAMHAIALVRAVVPR